MHGDQRRGKSAKGHNQQDYRTDTTCGESPDKASDAKRLSPHQNTSTESHPWFELHITMLCHIVLICVNGYLGRAAPGSGSARPLHVAYPWVKPGIADVYEEVNDYKSNTVQQNQVLDHCIIKHDKGFYHHFTQTGDIKSLFDNHGTTEQEPKEDTRERDNR